MIPPPQRDGARARRRPRPSVGSPLTQVVIQATNQDPVDYALWIEWEDAAGAISVQSYLFSVFGDPFCGPTTNFVIVQADPSISYTILLADPWGAVYDTYQLLLPTATSVDVSFNIVDGYLYRTIP